MPGIKIPIGRGIRPKYFGKSWQSYWPHQSEVLFFGLYSEISGGQMPNKVTGATDYLTVAGVAGSETYQCPNTAPYIAADTDYIWFQGDGTQRTVTTTELIGYDLQRTPVKYDDTTPNAIVAIMILSSAVTGAKRDRLFKDMWLPVFWDNNLNAYGHLKDNRIAQTLSPKVPTGLTLTLISGGVKLDWTDNSGGKNETEIWGQSDGASYALLYTINAGTVTKNDSLSAVDMRYYKIRAKSGSYYSEFTNAISIAMLGSEKITTGWNGNPLSSWWGGTINANWSSDGSVILSDGNTGNLGKGGGFWTIGKTYRIVITITRSAGSIIPPYDGSGGPSALSSSGTHTIIYSPDSNTAMNIYSVSFNGTITALSLKEILAP